VLILHCRVNPQVIRKNLGFMSNFACDLGMAFLEQFQVHTQGINGGFRDSYIHRLDTAWRRIPAHCQDFRCTQP